MLRQTPYVFEDRPGLDSLAGLCVEVVYLVIREPNLHRFVLMEDTLALHDGRNVLFQWKVDV